MSGFFCVIQTPMNVKKITVFLLFGLCLAVVLFLLLVQTVTPETESEGASAVSETLPKSVSPSLADKTKRSSSERIAAPKKTVQPESAKPPVVSTTGDIPRGHKTAPKLDPEEALKQWEARLLLYTEDGAKERVATTPVTEQEQEELCNCFSALTPEQKLENINHAMNLLPDETFTVVRGILLDTAQPPEVVNVIFHDLLNRDEAIKYPLLKEIAKNKAHPMYVEAARILDIVNQ
jgi:hypothetical protein